MDSQIKPKILKDRREIESTVRRLAEQLNEDYRDRKPVLVAVLKGAFVFLADLIRHLDLQVEVEFICLSSYGKGKESSGEVRLVQDLCTDIKGRDVIIVEDIIDSGLTTDYLINYLKKQQPSSVKVCALTSKPSRRELAVSIDYLGFEVPDKFIVGYGLDCGEKFRHLPDICFIEEEQ